MEHMKVLAQEINRDMTHRKCVPSHRDVYVIGEEVASMRERLGQTNETMTLFPQSHQRLKDHLLLALEEEKKHYEGMAQDLRDLDSEFQRTTRMWHHLTQAYELIAKRAAPVQAVFDEIKHVVPNSDRRLKGGLAFLLQQNRRKKIFLNSLLNVIHYFSIIGCQPRKGAGEAQARQRNCHCY